MSAAELNTEQQRAVEVGNGLLCIIAGPGTGKTKTLTARIIRLLERGVPAHEILALTFTNKAAREMRERVVASLPSHAHAALPEIATFHGLCHKLLAAAGDITFVTDAQRQQIIRELKRSQKHNTLSVRELGLRISKLKNQVEAPTDPIEKQLLTAYNHALASQGLYDFDDLLQKLHEQLRQHPQQKPTFQHILVDEFQDTNELQYSLLKLLNTTDNLCVIGDPLQSIYGFRGASAVVFDRFLMDWPQTQQVTLTTNYRSVPEVVAVANAVFADTPQLHAHATEQGEAQAIEALDGYAEAAWIIGQIEQGVGGSDFLKSSQQHGTTGDNRQRGFRDFAVLYRTHAAAQTLRKCLDESGIPYQVAGEGSPYEQPGIATIIAALRWLAGEQVTVAKLTPTQCDALLAPLKNQQLPLIRTIPELSKLLGLDEKIPAHDLQQFTQTAMRFDGQPIQDFLTYIDKMAEQDFYDPNAEAVTLLTIHAAKGLEFPHVFLIATEEGILPHLRKDSLENVDEERRLFYVAVTRARDTLHILHARSRGGVPAAMSRFVCDIPSSLLPRQIDPSIEAQLKKRERARQKRAQTSLF